MTRPRTAPNPNSPLPSNGSVAAVEGTSVNMGVADADSHDRSRHASVARTRIFLMVGSHPFGRSSAFLILQDSLEGAQQRAALLESSFAEVCERQNDLLAAATQQTADQPGERLRFCI